MRTSPVAVSAVKAVADARRVVNGEGRGWVDVGGEEERREWKEGKVWRAWMGVWEVVRVQMQSWSLLAMARCEIRRFCWVTILSGEKSCFLNSGFCDTLSWNT